MAFKRWQWSAFGKVPENYILSQCVSVFLTTLMYSYKQDFTVCVSVNNGFKDLINFASKCYEHVGWMFIFTDEGGLGIVRKGILKDPVSIPCWQVRLAKDGRGARTAPLGSSRGQASWPTCNASPRTHIERIDSTKLSSDLHTHAHPPNK